MTRSIWTQPDVRNYSWQRSTSLCELQLRGPGSNLFVDPRRLRKHRRERRFSLIVNDYFKYTESFFKSSGMGGKGGNSCENPLNSGAVISERSLPSCTAILCGLPTE